MSLNLTLPDIDPRFLPLQNWQNGEFLNPKTNHQIHYNFILPPEQSPNGIIIILPGLSEFGEKYIETAKFFSEQGYGIYIIDWAYQGRSTRLKENPHKRHSDSYNSDLSDLNYLIKNIIGTKQPLFMLAHSMGGNIGLRYISEHPNIFKAASLSAPMLGIKALKYISCFIKPLLSILTKFQLQYIPGGRNWHADSRVNKDKDIFSSDLIRREIHNKWFLKNPSLQVGNVTLKWVDESLKSISILKKEEILKKINIPILTAIAGKEALVDNQSTENASKIIPHAKLLKLKNSKHEILMEIDDIRNKFLTETIKIFNQ